jgi:hypothetical protein
MTTPEDLYAILNPRRITTPDAYGFDEPLQALRLRQRDLRLIPTGCSGSSRLVVNGVL